MGSAAERLRLASSARDARSGKFWAGVLAEYVGTMMFLLIAMGSIILQGNTAEDIHIALGVGLALAASIWVTGAASGGHLNPAVSFAMLLMRKISLLKFVTYALMQCFGAITGVAILRGVTPAARFGTFGTTVVNEMGGVTIGQGFGTEIMITFMLVLTVFACCDGDRTDLKGSAPLAIGLSVTIGHLFALHLTGASMNPARSLGSSAISGVWTHHWVYWVAPMIGAVVAGVLYDLLFAVDASPKKAADWFIKPDYTGKAERPQDPYKADGADEKDGKMQFDSEM